MDVSSIASLATALSQEQTQQAVQLAVLRKALDLEKQSAAQLIAVAEATPATNPAHLGNQVDTFA